LAKLILFDMKKLILIDGKAKKNYFSLI